MTRYFYGRCSTQEQNLNRQMDVAREQGIDPANCYFDKISGTKRSRPALDELFSKLQEGDSVVCLSLDRLSRSTSDLMEMMDTFQERGINLVSIHEGLDTSGNSEVARLIFTVFAAVAEFQRNIILTNCAEGRAAKIARDGKCGGRKPLPESKKKAVREMKASGSSVKEICEALGVSKASVYRIWNGK